MSGKNPDHIRHILTFLSRMKALDNWEIKSIENLKRIQVAEVLGNRKYISVWVVPKVASYHH